MIDLRPEHLATVRRILDESLPGVEVRVFGSRASGSAREHSDLDLALVAQGAVDQGLLERLRDAFSESDLPFSVDVADWNALPESLRGAIREQGYKVLRPVR